MKDKKSSIGAKNHPLFLQTDERIRIIVDKINLIVIGCLLNLSKIPTDYFFFFACCNFFSTAYAGKATSEFFITKNANTSYYKGTFGTGNLADNIFR